MVGYERGNAVTRAGSNDTRRAARSGISLRLRRTAAFWGLTTLPRKQTRARVAGLAAKLGGTLRGLGQERRNRGPVSRPRASAVAASA